MPVYVYQCSKCGRFERTVPMEQRHTIRCPECEGTVQLIPSLFSYSFGWVLDSLTDDIPRRNID